MYKYFYKSKKTNKNIVSHTPINDEDLELVSKVKNTSMRRTEVKTKSFTLEKPEIVRVKRYADK